MVKIMDIPDSRGRESFWEAYRACAEENRARSDRSPFYVNWARDFANFLPEKPLKERSGKDIEAFPADMEKRRGTQPRCSWHGGKLSKKERGVKIVKEKNLIKGVPNPDLENGNPFSICHCESRQKREKVRACTPKCLPLLKQICAAKRSGTQAWQSPWKNRDCFASLAKTVS